MAEIKIEKKKPVWPWILLVLIILAAIAYFAYEYYEDDHSDDVDIEEVDDVNNTTINDTNTYEDTADYSDSNLMMQYNESIRDSTRIGMDSTYTKTALHNLSKAVTSKASQYNLEPSKALEDLKKYAVDMDGVSDSQMKNSAGISKNIKSVSDNIVTVLQAIQTKTFPDLQPEVADLKQSSMKINSTVIEKQQTTLQAFFKKANEVLNRMNS